MALIGNGSLLNKSFQRLHGGTATAIASHCNVKASLMSTNILRARAQLQFKQASIPGTGYGPGTAFMMPMTGGELGIRRVEGVATVTGTGLSAMIAALDAIAGVATVTGSANAIGLIQIAGTSDGVASVTAFTLVASSMSGTIAGIATVDANLGAVIPCEASSAGLASSSVNLKGTGRLGGDITIGGTGYLSNDDVERLAAAVIESEIETSFNLKEAFRLVLSATAGKLSGAAGTTITIRNVVDDKNRIVATVDSNGNRTSLTYDVGD
jgi:hypothetical protein